MAVSIIQQTSGSGSFSGSSGTLTVPFSAGITSASSRVMLVIYAQHATVQRTPTLGTSLGVSGGGWFQNAINQIGAAIAHGKMVGHFCRTPVPGTTNITFSFAFVSGTTFWVAHAFEMSGLELLSSLPVGSSGIDTYFTSVSSAAVSTNPSTKAAEINFFFCGVGGSRTFSAPTNGYAITDQDALAGSPGISLATSIKIPSGPSDTLSTGLTFSATSSGIYNHTRFLGVETIAGPANPIDGGASFGIGAVTHLLTPLIEVDPALPKPLDIGVDMWVADGGAASQLFNLDTQVSTPLIVGDHTVSENTNVQFNVANLDSDVVDITIGPSSVGVLSITNFVNNGDGTGTFLANFDPVIVSRHMTIIATDDVDNASNESPIFVVNDLEDYILGEEIVILPQDTVSSETCQRLLDGVPRSSFILKRKYTLPYSFNTTAFELQAVTPNEPVTIVVARRGIPGEPTETQQYVIIPSQVKTIVNLRLGKGINIITALDNFRRSDTIIVAATTYASVLCTYAREIYNFSQVRIREQETAIFSPVSTRLAEPLLAFADLLPDVKSQQTLATKLAVRSLVSSPGKEIGVSSMLSALTLSTPIFVAERPHDELFEPSVFPMFNAQEAFAGVDAHVWFANECVRKWLAFIHYINSVNKFKVISITENEVIYEDPNGDVQRVVFDFTRNECSLTNLALQSICFQDVDVLVSIFSTQVIAICAATYPMDMRPVPDFPMHPIGDEDTLDPGFDGYVDFSATEHWDGGVTLDSQGAIPSVESGLDSCVYGNGYLTEPLLLSSDSVLAPNYVNASGEIDVFGPQRGVMLQMYIQSNEKQIASSIDMLINHPVVRTSIGVSVIAMPEIALGLDVVISS